MLLEAIRRGSNLQESVLHELDALVQVIAPIIAAGTEEVALWNGDPDGDCDSCRIELRRTEVAEALYTATLAIEALRDEIELTLDVVQAREGTAPALNSTAHRHRAKERRPTVLPEE